MGQLTPRQEEYLLLFAARSGQDRCITAVAEQLQVSKPSAFNISKMLESEGMINKSPGGEITLTESGWEHISAKLECLQALSEWLKASLGLTASLARQEARHMVVYLEEETILLIMRQMRSVPAAYCCAGPDGTQSGPVSCAYRCCFKVI